MFVKHCLFYILLQENGLWQGITQQISASRRSLNKLTLNGLYSPKQQDKVVRYYIMSKKYEAESQTISDNHY